MNTADPRVSFAELQQWPDDGRQYELYDGEVIVVPAPFPRHQRVALRIASVLRRYEDAAGGIVLHAPIDIVLTEHDVVQPDVVFFRAGRVPSDLMAAIRIPPDLAVEVVSGRTEARDRGRKMRLFARAAVPEYWIADPVANVLEVFVLRSGTYELAGAHTEADTVRSVTLPGLTCGAAEVFQD